MTTPDTNTPNTPGTYGTYGTPNTPTPAYGAPARPEHPGRHSQPTADRWNGFAVAGLILSILGGWLGLILAIAALVQINKHGGKGRTLAIAAIIIAILWIIAGVALAATGNL